MSGLCRLDPIKSCRREVWLSLLASVPPVRKPFPFGADSWLTWASRNVKCCEENSLHFSCPTGMSGVVPQETSSPNPAGSQGSREHAPYGQNTLKKYSSAGLSVFVYSLIASKTKGFLVMADFIYHSLSFSRLFLVVSAHHPTRLLSNPSNICSSYSLSGLFFFLSYAFYR